MLHMAVVHTHVNLACLLLQFGATVNKVDAHENTALCFSLTNPRHFSYNLARLLLEWGMEPSKIKCLSDREDPREHLANQL